MDYPFVHWRIGNSATTNEENIVDQNHYCIRHAAIIALCLNLLREPNLALNSPFVNIKQQTTLAGNFIIDIVFAAVQRADEPKLNSGMKRRCLYMHTLIKIIWQANLYAPSFHPIIHLLLTRHEDY